MSEDKGQCSVTFTDPTTKREPGSVGSTVCFTVSPADAGSVGTGSGHCAVIGSNHKAFGTFTASGEVCGEVVITAHELTNGDKAHHTTIRIVCKSATTTAAVIPAGSPLPPAGGWLLGAMGVAGVLVTAYAVRTRNWFAPRRLAAAHSA